MKKTDWLRLFKFFNLGEKKSKIQNLSNPKNQNNFEDKISESFIKFNL